jgi:hypothetical protein
MSPGVRMFSHRCALSSKCDDVRRLRLAPLRPSLHHRPTLFEGIAAAVCGLGFVAYRMRKSAFAKLRRERADFRSSIRKRRSEPVRGYRPSPAHALQQHEHRHIGQWSAGLLTGKNEFRDSRLGEFADDGEGTAWKAPRDARASPSCAPPGWSSAPH